MAGDAKVYVIGVSMTPFGKFMDSTVKDLSRQAIDEALLDADVDRKEIEIAFFANTTQGMLEGQHYIPGQIAIRSAGLDGIPVVNVENACASGTTTLHLAAQYIRSGAADIALAVGCDKMSHPDRSKSFSIFESGWDVSSAEENANRILRLGEGLPHEGPPEGGGSRSLFMDIYASWARYHMVRFGVTQRQLAIVAAKNHRHSQWNDRSQFRHPYTVDEVLASRLISYPLTLYMCAPISDGATAAVLCSERALRGLPRGRAVEILATVLESGIDREDDDLQNHITRRAARRAYAIAGVGPQDISVAEVHDATAFGEIMQVENLGFCSMGEGGLLSESGATAIGGRIPVNTSGGLECKGHPIAATGLAQIYELVTQLRHESGPRQVEGAKLAIAENGGGLIGVEEAVACVTILGRGRVTKAAAGAAV